MISYPLTIVQRIVQAGPQNQNAARSKTEILRRYTTPQLTPSTVPDAEVPCCDSTIIVSAVAIPRIAPGSSSRDRRFGAAIAAALAEAPARPTGYPDPDTGEVCCIEGSGGYIFGGAATLIHETGCIGTGGYVFGGAAILVLSVTASTAFTMPAEVMSATGNVVGWKGTSSLLSIRETMSAIGNTSHHGTMAKSLAPEAMSATGNVVSWICSSAPLLMIRETMTATGNVVGWLSSSAAFTLPAETMAATGNVVSWISSNNAAFTLAAEVMAATGNVIGWKATPTLAMIAEVMAASGNISHHGTMAKSLIHEIMAASGTISSHGTSAMTTIHMTMAATGAYTAPSAGILFVQKQMGQTTSSTFTATWDSTTTAGNFLGLVLCSRGTGDPNWTATGWTLRSKQSSSGSWVGIYFKANASAESGAVSATNNSGDATQINEMYISEWSGLVSGGTQDVTNFNSNSFSATLTTGSTGTLFTANELILIGSCSKSPVSTITLSTPINSFTQRATQSSDAVGFKGASDWQSKVVAATTATSGGATASNSGSWVQVIASFY